MGCGCSAAGGVPGALGEAQPVVPAYQLPSETTECFMKRVAGQAVPPGVPPAEHIATQFIVVDCTMKTDTTFTMTAGSHPVTWNFVMKDDQGAVVDPVDFGLTYDNNAGKLTGTFKPAYEKKTIHAHMKALAKDGTNPDVPQGQVVDEKEYKFVPKKCDPNDLKLINPNPGAPVTSRFGPRNCTGCSPYHKGIDLASHGANDIIAAADGTVVYAGVQNGYGNCVEIAHKNPSGGVIASTFYGHLASIYVAVGQQVPAGTKIGHEGNSGHSTGPHLHFELRLQGRKGQETDPEPYINGKILVDAQVDQLSDPGAPSGTNTTKTNKHAGLSQEQVEVAVACGPLGASPTPAAAVDAKPPKSVAGCPGKLLDCAPAGWTPPPKSQVAQEIFNVLKKNGVTNFQDQLYFICVAFVESVLCQYAQYNGPAHSDAAGLWQFLTSTGTELYQKSGIQWNCINRANIEYSTIAMIRMFNRDELSSWHKYHDLHDASYTDPRLADLSRMEFMYECHGQGPGGVKKQRDGDQFIGFRQNFAKSSFLWNLPDEASVIAAIKAKPGG